jgi:hypothetical protein
MFGTNAVVPEQADLFLRVHNDNSGLVREAFEHQPPHLPHLPGTVALNHRRPAESRAPPSSLAGMDAAANGP